MHKLYKPHLNGYPQPFATTLTKKQELKFQTGVVFVFLLKKYFFIKANVMLDF